jgi:DNA repair protein RadC
MSTPPQRRALPGLVRTLRENGRLLAALARRCEIDRLAPSPASATFREPADIAAYLGPEMVNLPQEQLRVVLLDRRGRLIDTPLIYQGGQTETAVRLADCFRDAVRANAAAMVLVHNHPSSDSTPSADDVQLTHDAGKAGFLLGITVLDHVILCREGTSSLRALGLYIPPPPPHGGGGSASASSEALADATLPRVRRPRRRGDGVFGWGYDCARCGARVRGLDAGRISCQRCLAPVTCRAIDTAREIEVSEPTEPAAA